MNNIPTIPTFQNVFELLKASSYNGVFGVIRLDGPRPGPVLGITAMTHGNEPSGLAIFEHLLGSEIDIRNNLLCGTLYLVVNNIEATQKYFEAEVLIEGDQKTKAIRSARYCDVNMNRLPSATMELHGHPHYEVRRAQELYPIWSTFQYGLDVHSTTAASPPMIISRGDVFHEGLVRGFPIQDLLLGIDKIQINTPAFAFYGNDCSDSMVFAIEAGQHADPVSFQLAAGCTLALLQNLQMLDGVPSAQITEYHEYKIEEKLMFQSSLFDLVRNFTHKYVIYEGDLLAENSVTGERLRAPFDGHLLLPSLRRGSEKDIKEEVSFLSRPMRIRRA